MIAIKKTHCYCMLTIPEYSLSGEEICDVKKSIYSELSMRISKAEFMCSVKT